MKIGIYPGSFDPITLGHLDIIVRASGIVDQLIIGVLENSNKHPLFTAEERVDLIERVMKNNNLPTVKVEAFDGLLIDYVKKKEASIIVRGLRAVTDFEYELQIAQINHKLEKTIDTIFFTTSVEYSYLSSSVVKEIASYNGNIRQFVPECIVQTVYDKYKLRSV